MEHRARRNRFLAWLDEAIKGRFSRYWLVPLVAGMVMAHPAMPIRFNLWGLALIGLSLLGLLVTSAGETKAQSRQDIDDTPGQSDQATASIPWRQILVAVLLWFVGCSLAGIFLAVLSGEFGSIGFVIAGVAIGSCGALSHAALLLVRRFRALPGLQRRAAIWFVSMAAFLALGVSLSWSASDLSMMSLYVAVPTLLAAIGVDLVLVWPAVAAARRSAPR